MFLFAILFTLIVPSFQTFYAYFFQNYTEWRFHNISLLSVESWLLFDLLTWFNLKEPFIYYLSHII